MKKQATIIYVTGDKKELNHRPTLKEAQGIVGGYIEMVKGPPNITIICDEDGKMKGYPENHTTSELFKPWLLVGNVIVLEGWRTVG